MDVSTDVYYMTSKPTHWLILLIGTTIGTELMLKSV